MSLILICLVTAILGFSASGLLPHALVSFMPIVFPFIMLFRSVVEKKPVLSGPVFAALMISFLAGAATGHGIRIWIWLFRH
jgi:hypothetical protein